MQVIRAQAWSWARLTSGSAWRRALANHQASYSLSSRDALSSVFQHRITPAVCSDLASNGFAVIDNLFDQSFSGVLRGEIMELFRTGLMHPNSTHLVKDNATQLLQKHNVHEAELTFDESIQAKAPMCAKLNADHSLPVMLSLFLPKLTLDAQAIKLQVNTGRGGCFPCHFDTDETLDGRKVTCIFYLNPGWKESDGGQLRLYPFPRCPPVDIDPLNNRLVIFSSARMLHRVLPSAAEERVCFTIWLSQSSRRTAHMRPAPSLSALSAKAKEQPSAALDFLLQPPVRKHLLKLVYADEWARSIEESHVQGSDCNDAVKQHWKEVEIIQKALGDHAAVINSLKQSVCNVAAGNGTSMFGLPTATPAALPQLAWF